MGYHPIAQVKTEDNKREGIIFIDSQTLKPSFFRLTEIREKIQRGEIIGMTCNNSNIKLYQFYSNIGTVGDNGTSSITIFKKLVSPKETVYLVSDTVGNVERLSRDEIKQKILNGEQVAGVKYIEPDKLKFSKEIELGVIPETGM